MSRVLFDIEANGLLNTVDTLWCCVAKDLDSDITRRYSPFDWDQAIAYLQSADVLVGHNIITYDLPCIWKIYGEWDSCPLIIDTLVCSAALWPERPGGHSLEAWGKRLGYPKGDFNQFNEYSEEMLEYCERDVELNHLVLKKLEVENNGNTFPGYKVY